MPLFADSTGKRHPLYTIIVMLRKEKENLDKSTIQLLDSYGMTWGRDKTDLNTLVKTILIPWCDKNGKKIPDINKTDKEIYALVSKLKRKKELLTEETLVLLNDYGINDERRESSPKPKEILEKLKQNIEDKLIAWCKANNKQIYQIKAMLGDKHNPLYSFIINLRKVKHLLDNVTIELLNSYGMVWSGERAEFVIKRTKDKIKQNAKTKLIPWCVKNKISISQMLSTEPEYSIVKNLREIEDDLDEDFVNLLNNYGMVWKNDLINGRRANHKVLEGRIKNELIYWCKINNKTLKQIPSHDENGDIHPMYRILINARRAANGLSKEIIDLLNQYEMIWEKKTRSINAITGLTRVKPSERVRLELVPWCEKHQAKIIDVPIIVDNKINPLYNFIISLRHKRNKLDAETIALLNSYGMLWDGRRKRNAVCKRIDEELIPWCVENNKQIYELPCEINGKANPLYMLVYKLRMLYDELDEETIKLLNKFGMVWKINLVESTRLKVLARLKNQIKTVLIPWCKENEKTISQIPKCEFNKQNPLYILVKKIIKNKEDLDEETIALLNTYGINWDDCIVKKSRKTSGQITTCEQDLEEKKLNPETNNYNLEIDSHDIDLTLLVKQQLETQQEIKRLQEETVSSDEAKPISVGFGENITPTQEDINISTKVIIEGSLVATGNTSKSTYSSGLGTIQTSSSAQLIKTTNKEIKHKQSKIQKSVFVEIDKTKEIKIKLKNSFNAVIKWMDKKLAYISNITKNTPCYEDLQFIIQNVSLLEEELLEELKLYGFDVSLTSGV